MRIQGVNMEYNESEFLIETIVPSGERESEKLHFDNNAHFFLYIWLYIF